MASELWGAPGTRPVRSSPRTDDRACADLTNCSCHLALAHTLPNRLAGWHHIRPSKVVGPSSMGMTFRIVVGKDRLRERGKARRGPQEVNTLTGFWWSCYYSWLISIVSCRANASRSRQRNCPEARGAKPRRQFGAGVALLWGDRGHGRQNGRVDAVFCLSPNGGSVCIRYSVKLHRNRSHVTPIRVINH